MQSAEQEIVSISERVTSMNYTKNRLKHKKTYIPLNELQLFSTFQKLKLFIAFYLIAAYYKLQNESFLQPDKPQLLLVCLSQHKLSYRKEKSSCRCTPRERRDKRTDNLSPGQAGRRVKEKASYEEKKNIIRNQSKCALKQIMGTGVDGWVRLCPSIF